MFIACASVFKFGNRVCSLRPWVALINFRLKPIISALAFDGVHALRLLVKIF